MFRIVLTMALLAAPFAATAGAQAKWEGKFTIASKFKEMAIDVPEGKSDEGLAIIQWGLHGNDAQQWGIEIVDAARGWYKIVNAFNGMALDIKDGSKEDRAVLIQSKSGDAKSQHWRIDADRDGSYKIVSRFSGKAIDIPFGSKEQGTTLELCEDNNQANQRWVFKKVGAPEPVAEPISPPALAVEPTVPPASYESALVCYPVRTAPAGARRRWLRRN